VIFTKTGSENWLGLFFCAQQHSKPVIDRATKTVLPIPGMELCCLVNEIIKFSNRPMIVLVSLHSRSIIVKDKQELALVKSSGQKLVNNKR